MTPPQDANQDDADQLIGRVIAGNFRIDRLIGSGAMGNVYQAEQLSLGKEVAVKILHRHLMSDEKLVRRFQREAKSASRLNHPNSIQIIDSGRDGDGVLYIAMELLTGRDLAQVIRDEFPLPLPRIVHIMSQVLSALGEAHANGVIHRDLKPSNIMLIERLDEPDFVKVCDYGIAKSPMEETKGDGLMLTVQGLVCGTPEYMSPEQARGEVLDGRTDLYSAAVILYQMVTGDIPFRASTPIGIVSRHLSEPPPVPSAQRHDPGFPPDLDELILRGLAKTRDLRPPSAHSFREDLESITNGGLGRRARAGSSTLPAASAFAGGSSSSHPAMSAPVPAPVAPARKTKMIVAAVGGAVLISLITALAVRAPSGGTPTVAATPAAATTATSALPPAPPPAPSPGESPTQENAEAARETGALANAQAGKLPRPVPGHLVRRKVDKVEVSARPTPATNAAVAAKKTTTTPTPTTPTTTTTTPSAAADVAPTHPAAPANDASPAGATTRGPRELLAEGEKLLTQGEVAEACRRGEDAKKMAPRLAAAYKFVGKCYMRAGSASLAKDNYRHYLELAPNAPDAVFIESIVK